MRLLVSLVVSVVATAAPTNLTFVCEGACAKVRCDDDARIGNLVCLHSVELGCPPCERCPCEEERRLQAVGNCGEVIVAAGNARTEAARLAKIKQLDVQQCPNTARDVKSLLPFVEMWADPLKGGNGGRNQV